MQPGSCGKNADAGRWMKIQLKIVQKNKTQEISGVESDHKNEIQVGRVEVPETIAYAIWKKLGIFAELTDELRQDARYLPVYELLYQIYRKTGYYDYVSSMPAGETRRANLDMLAEKAAAPAPAPVAPAAPAPADDLQLIAVITAAIAAAEGTSTDGFVVRSIKRRSNNKWKKA